ncbi:MAG TPA: S41 family peptidase, partial [Pyrinomonadaceae bacterium]|nr:S41 family peptidase [Pyrinomonadaceae bacterium]
ARKFVVNYLKVTALLLVICLNAQAQQPGQTPLRQSADDARIARLVGLAKVWGAVKYFHPFLAYRDIDWDKALVETIPKVETARTPPEYQAALNQMLAALGDKSTRAEIGTETKAAPPNQPATSAKEPARTEPVRTENGVLVIEATRAARTGAQDIDAFRRLLGKIGEDIPAAKGVVIDARDAVQADDYVAYFFGGLLRQILPQVLDANVTLGSTRYRMHNGYATQVGGGAGFYYSAFVNVAPETLAGQNKAKTPPIVFIVNENTPEATGVLSGLQSAGRAFVIQEGERAQELGGSSYTLELPDGVKVRMRTSEPINPDGSTGFQADAVVAKSAGEDAAMREAVQAAQQNRVGQARTRAAANLTTQVSQKDKTYAEMSFPATEYRLLALFRFWNVINYFYPYKDLIGDSWETALPRYIPKFEANKDAVDYQLTVREMVAEMRDSHGGVQNANASAEKLGAFVPPVLLRYVEAQTVVTHVLDDKLPVKIGDVILSVDGEPVERRREFLSRFIAASTPQALERSVHAGLLRGQKDSTAKLRVRGADGAAREVVLPRSVSLSDRKLFTARQRSTPVVEVLPGGSGYVDLARLQVGEVDQMFETIKGTPAVIFDMRGYPNGTAWAIAPRLSEKTMPVAALFSRPLLEATGLSDTELAGSVNYSFTQKLPERKGDAYKGKVVMLINEDAISQAEHTCMFFEAATDVTFIGTPTTGANGDVTFMVLPGNLPVTFTGHNVRHADGRQLQRIGIQPTVRVAPTIRGVAAGHDEVLDGAVKYLRETVKK